MVDIQHLLAIPNPGSIINKMRKVLHVQRERSGSAEVGLFTKPPIFNNTK